MTLRTSPLDIAHRELGAKMVPFGGWDMPLAYGDGTIAEHRACREAAVAEWLAALLQAYQALAVSTRERKGV